MIGMGTNCATDESSGGALDGWKPRAASLMETDCAPFIVLAGTAGSPPDRATGAGLLATAVVGAAAGVGAGAGAVEGAALPAFESESEELSESESDDAEDLEPVSTSATSFGGGAAPGGAAAGSVPARRASAL